jgi:hypothetical protein
MAKEKNSTRSPRNKKSVASVQPITRAAEPGNGNGSALATVSTRSVDMQEVIRQRAYELYEQRGRQHGRDFDDWLRAESEVLTRFGARPA